MGAVRGSLTKVVLSLDANRRGTSLRPTTRPDEAEYKHSCYG